MDGRPDIHSDDFYEVLGVAKSATPEAIKRAYLALVREHTPERSPEIFKRIRAAYETLSDPVARERYDARPSAPIQALLNQANLAMNARNFREAEQFYREVLSEQPQLSWVRNLLGVCLLYQKRPADAIEQYELILAQPSADPWVHNNLAHAYAMVLRCDEAEREYRVAMSLAGDHAYHFGIALIDMIIEFRHDPAAAEQVALDLLKATTPGSPAAAAYYTKLIELALRLKRADTIRAIVLRMIQGVETDDAKRITAGALGNIGAHLITQKLFDLSASVAHTASQLAPEDHGAQAVEQLAWLLHQRDYLNARRLVRGHFFFAPQGPVPWLVTWVEGYIKECTAPQVPAPPAARRAAGARGGGSWFVRFAIVAALSQVFNLSNRESLSSSPEPEPEKTETRFAGVFTSTPNGDWPIQANLSLVFADLRNGDNGYCMVSPPLAMGGFCTLHASRDTASLAIYSGADIIALRGIWVADTIFGTYRIQNGTVTKGIGEWRAWFVGGLPIPP